jgi:hypothetical protein
MAKKNGGKLAIVTKTRFREILLFSNAFDSLKGNNCTLRNYGTLYIGTLISRDLPPQITDGNVPQKR